MESSEGSRVSVEQDRRVREGHALTWKVAMTLLRACWNSSSSPQRGWRRASLWAHRLWKRNQSRPRACRKGSRFPCSAPKAASAGNQEGEGGGVTQGSRGERAAV